MSGESPKKIGRGYERNLDAGPFQPMIDSWDLHLRAEKKSAKTIRTYLEDTWARLSELAGLAADDVSLRDREAVVTGKGDKQRTIRFTYDTARALDRYQRGRARHKMARVSALWLGVRGGPMTASGVYQMIERRGRDAGVEVNPHKFRLTFSHVFLDRGGAEGDLMELNGWSSPQMLARYGRSARSARARRHYDDVMGA